jgi:acetyl/propionyl-CoA carboxylase alpha subunit/acetyl-CoA carboxylase carboxyltransferase component
MTIKSLLVANRGEIAIRIARAASELGIRTVAIFSEDDARSLHVRRADHAAPLRGAGAKAYLDIAQIVALATAEGCDAVHPGYGFLSENAAFARACLEAGLIFVGPNPAVLELFGDKASARRLAARCGVAVSRGTAGPTTLDQAREFLADLGPGGAVMVKALAGGGGRGMRMATSATELDEAYQRAGSEAKAAFGRGEVYVEELVANARHIEVQVIGDGGGAIVDLGERECSVQRSRQKIMEIAPSPTLSADVRAALADAAVTMAREAGCVGLATFEFLVPVEAPERFVYIETNPRLQVEHTVTEAVTGVDLVKAQLRIAGGETLAQIGLDPRKPVPPLGYAIQLRINMETMRADGVAVPSSGMITVYEPASGPGVRVDGYGYSGFRPSPNFDSLLAKLIVHSPSPRYADAIIRARRALSEFRIEGIGVNLEFLAALLDHPDVARNQVSTRFLDEHVAEFATAAPARLQLRGVDAFFAAGPDAARAAAPTATGPDGAVAVPSPMTGLVIAIDVREGDLVRPGQQLAVLEAMKMQHVITAGVGGVVRLITAKTAEVLAVGQPVLFIEPKDGSEASIAADEVKDLDAIRPDLAEVVARHALNQDAARPEAVARRHAKAGRTARQNVEDLCDPGSFIEYGGLTIAAQRSRRPLEELLRTTPADGLIAGLGTVNAAQFGEDRGACAVAAYDYTVLAGTQGAMNHKKQDRFYRLVHELRRPLVLFAEGGGGRPGDTDNAHIGVSGGDLPTWFLFGGLSGLVPLIGIVHGRCFAGNAALLGCCDVIIATESATIGMGGPAMIEGGGLGVYEPEEVGPVGMQAPNGVIDVVVRDEAEAVATAKRYLSYFQGPLADWKCADQRLLRSAIPENRLRVYDIRSVIRTLADEDSVLEIRSSFGIGIVTALIRLEGHPFGLIANNPMHLGGAIDADAADKAARFIQLCDGHDIPILSLTDTPGFMVGPEAEKQALVRRACRMFVNGATSTGPYFTVVLRKGYGLGAMAMARGYYHGSIFTVSWPTGEFGGMGLEGAVRLAYRKELADIADPDEREAEFRRRVALSYERGKAINTASVLEIDDVIDPMETRRWVLRGLKSVAPRPPRVGKKRQQIEPW